MERIYDCIIVGGGPSGLSCALYLLRANKDVIVFENNEPLGNLRKIKEIDNYLGFSKISGNDLADKMLNHVNNYKNDLIVKYNIQNIYKENDLFIVTDYQSIYKSKTLVIATGIEIKPIISNVDQYVGKGVSYCISCDGFLYKDKNVILIGNTNSLEEMKNEFKSITNSIQLINIDDLNNPYIKGDDRVEYFINNGKEYKCDGIFIDPKYSSLDINMPINKNRSFIIVDENFQTNINNLYAIGDIVDKKLRQVSTAVSDGAIAATSLIKNL